MSNRVQEDIMQKLTAYRSQMPGTGANLSQYEVNWVCQRVRPIILREQSLLELEGPITICGDIHGQFHDLTRIFETSKLSSHSGSYLFLGDYVDRGVDGLEVVILLFLLKINYPDKVYLLRGNHESKDMTRSYGFKKECKKKISKDVWKTVSDVFNCLPFAAVVSNKIFCVHGGISPDIETLDDIRGIRRPCTIPDDGIIADLVWSDPKQKVSNWKENSNRGTGYYFGEEPTTEFLQKFGFTMICRGHQVAEKGFDYPFEPSKSVVTLFSAPNYCDNWDNDGAIMYLNSKSEISYDVITPIDYEESFSEPNAIPESNGEEFILA